MSIRALMIGAALATTPGLALACTPAPPAKLTPEEQVARARAYAEKAASPALAVQVRTATDISVIGIDGFIPGADTDLPPRYRENLGWYRKIGLLPVRYQFRVQRTIKGAPPPAFPFKFHLPNFTSDKEWAWSVAPNDEMEDLSLPRSWQAFWSWGGLALGQVSGGPGDCSNQVALDPMIRYLVLRDADGRVTAAEPLAADDPLPDLIAAALLNPSEGYLWRPRVAEFLAMPGIVVRVRITSCQDEQGTVTEVLRGRPTDRSGDVELGEMLSLYSMAPGFLISSCQIGSDYLVTGWPFGSRLHPVRQGQVIFEDRWMQLRFSGEKTMSLAAVRAILAGP